jgi:hypothetical protein
MDANECNTVIPAGRDTAGRTMDEVLTTLESSITQFSANVREKFKKDGEW